MAVAIVIAPAIAATIPIAIPPAIAVPCVGGLYAYLGGLGCCIVRVENPDAMGMLVAMPLDSKEIDAILQGAIGRDWLTIDEQLRAGLKIASADADERLSVRLCRQGDLHLGQRWNGIA